MASRSSSEPGLGRALRAIVLALLTAVVVGVGAGCVTVRPEEKEFLADPAMTFGSHGRSALQEEHVFLNREGSFGAGSVGGGGCGCN